MPMPIPIPGETITAGEGAAWITVVLLIVVGLEEGGGALLMVEALERPPALPPLRPPPRPAMRLLVGPKSDPWKISLDDASATSGVRRVENMNEAAIREDPIFLAKSLLLLLLFDMRSSVVDWVSATGAKAAD